MEASSGRSCLNIDPKLLQAKGCRQSMY